MIYISSPFKPINERGISKLIFRLENPVRFYFNEGCLAHKKIFHYDEKLKRISNETYESFKKKNPHSKLKYDDWKKDRQKRYHKTSDSIRKQREIISNCNHAINNINNKLTNPKENIIHKLIWKETQSMLLHENNPQKYDVITHNYNEFQRVITELIEKQERDLRIVRNNFSITALRNCEPDLLNGMLWIKDIQSELFSKNINNLKNMRYSDYQSIDLEVNNQLEKVL